MKRLELGRAARADLASIRSYTKQRWSAAQALRYVRQIDTVMHRLVAGELSGHSWNAGEYRSQRAGSHILFYREGDDLIAVVRILHERMDPERHLPR